MNTKPETKTAHGRSLPRMVSRWNATEIEAAAAIVNDIAEGIDNRETRKELRQALAIYADLLCDALQTKHNKVMARMLAALERLDAKLSANDQAEARRK